MGNWWKIRKRHPSRFQANAMTSKDGTRSTFVTEVFTTNLAGEPILMALLGKLKGEKRVITRGPRKGQPTTTIQGYRLHKTQARGHATSITASTPFGRGWLKKLRRDIGPLIRKKRAGKPTDDLFINSIYMLREPKKRIIYEWIVRFTHPERPGWDTDKKFDSPKVAKSFFDETIAEQLKKARSRYSDKDLKSYDMVRKDSKTTWFFSGDVTDRDMDMFIELFRREKT